MSRSVQSKSNLTGLGRQIQFLHSRQTERCRSVRIPPSASSARCSSSLSSKTKSKEKQPRKAKKKKSARRWPISLFCSFFSSLFFFSVVVFVVGSQSKRPTKRKKTDSHYHLLREKEKRPAVVGVGTRAPFSTSKRPLILFYFLFIFYSFDLLPFFCCCCHRRCRLCTGRKPLFITTCVDCLFLMER